MKALYSCILAVLLTNTVIPPSSAAQQQNEKWQVYIALHPEFPLRYHTILKKDLVYPLPEVASLKELWESDVEVLPSESSQIRPSHVDIAVSAFGIKRQILGTGILSFNSSGIAQALLRFPVELENAPKAEQITSLKNARKPHRLLYEITFLNPGSEQVNISRLEVHQ